jgi:hypothetical protein
VSGYVLKVLPDGLIPSSDENAIALTRFVLLFHAAVPLTFLRFVRLDPDGVGPIFRYRFESVDGRVWHQKLRYGEPGGPRQVFDVGDMNNLATGFKEDGEFSHQRAIRRGLSGLLATYPTLQEIEFTF